MKQAEVVSSNKEWKQHYETFQKEFLGWTDFADKTKITNPWVIDFEDGKNNTLLATAEEPLIIINKALGYKIYAELVAFQWSRNNKETAYKTYSKYKPLSPKTKKQKEIWKENRIKTYLGSFPHFLKNLYKSSLQQSEFSIQWISDVSKLKASETRFKLFESGISLGFVDQFKGYKLDDQIKVSYSQNYKYTTSQKKVSLSIRKKNRLSPNTREEAFFVHKNGNLLNPASLKVFGYWAKTRIADTLPSNYRIDNQ